MFDDSGKCDGHELLSVALNLRQEGQGWFAELPEAFGPGDDGDEATRSRILLFEDDRKLGPSHAQHDVIRRSGGGAFSHWCSTLYFSTSDGSDPRNNGRKYKIAIGPRDLSCYPLEVYLETINACNARCPFCPLFQGPSVIDRSIRPATIMPWTMFEKCVREISAWPCLPRTLYPHAYGEPLQDPLFARRLELLGELDLGRLVNLHTNGQFLSEKMARALLAARVRTISIAFDGATKEVYEAHRVRCDYDRVLQNIDNFVRLRREVGGRTEVAIIFVRTRDNEHEVAQAHEMFSRRLDPHLDEFHDKLSADWADEQGDADYYRLPKQRKRLIKGCSTLRNQLVVCSDGTIAACCIDYNLTVSDGGFGNVGDRTLLEIWRGDKRSALSENLNHGDFDVLPQKCRDCSSLFGEADLSLAKVDEELVTTVGSFELDYRFR